MRLLKTYHSHRVHLNKNKKKLKKKKGKGILKLVLIVNQKKKGVENFKLNIYYNF